MSGNAKYNTKHVPVAFDPIRKQLFVENLTLGMDPIAAVKAAGFTSRFTTTVRDLMADEDVIAMIEAHKRYIAEHYDVSREKVLRDLVDAKEMAKVQGDVKGIVMALNPVIDMQGYRAPKQLEVKSTHVNGNVRKRLRSISEDELIELAGEQGFEVLDLLPTTVDSADE